MFDANMRGLPKGKEFFAHVDSCTKKSLFHPLGVRSGQLILCTMEEADEDEPLVTFHLEGGDVTVRSREDEDFQHWFVYAGNKDLTGFFPKDRKVKAARLLGLLPPLPEPYRDCVLLRHDGTQDIGRLNHRGETFQMHTYQGSVKYGRTWCVMDVKKWKYVELFTDENSR